MGVMTVRELNADTSRAVDRAAAGEIIDITKDGRVVAELHSKPHHRSEDFAWQEAFSALERDLNEGVPFGRTFSHDERNN